MSESSREFADSLRLMMRVEIERFAELLLDELDVQATAPAEMATPIHIAFRRAMLRATERMKRP